MRTLTVVAVSLSYMSGFPAPLLAQERPPIIDMHMHADLPPYEVPGGAPALCRPEPCRGEGRATANHAETLEKTLQAMEHYNIVRAFLSGVDLKIVREWVTAAPGRFIASPFIAYVGRPDPETLEREYAAGRLSGMGEIATQLNGVSPNDPALRPYFALAEELDLPVLIHTAGIGPYLPGFRSTAGNPLLLEEVLVRHPKLRLYLENAGYPYRGEMIAMMYQYPQLYADVSTISWVIPRVAFYDYLEALVRAGLGKRLMFGSDQMRWPEKIGEGIEAIEQAPFLTEEQKRDILHNNAVRFLRLDEEHEQRFPGKMDAPIPQFGIREPGREYVVRPSAYLVLSSADGKIAIVRTNRGTFLPGGGVRADESALQAAARETLEESGLQVENLVEIGRADQFVYSEPEQTFFLKRCAFFRGRITAAGPSTEADHHLEWVAYGDALRILSHESQRWAVTEERRLTRA